MADTGFIIANAATSHAILGQDIAWLTPGNVTASDDVRTTATIAIGERTHFCLCRFTLTSVPVGATIKGVEVRVEHQSALGVGHELSRLRLFDVTTAVSDYKTPAITQDTSDVLSDIGGPADLWGASLPASVVRGDLRVGVECQKVGGLPAASRLDAIWMKIFYELPRLVSADIAQARGFGFGED